MKKEIYSDDSLMNLEQPLIRGKPKSDNLIVHETIGDNEELLFQNPKLLGIRMLLVEIKNSKASTKEIRIKIGLCVKELYKLDEEMSKAKLKEQNKFNEYILGGVIKNLIDRVIDLADNL